MMNFLKAIKEYLSPLMLGLVFLGFEGMGAYFLFNGYDLSRAITAIVTGFACVIFISISRFKHFDIKWLGITGELWEDKQKEAADLIKQLKNISPALAACSYSSLIAVGRFAGAIPSDARFQMAEELQDQLTEIGVPTRKIKEARKHFDRLLLVDMSGPMWDKIHKHLWDLGTDLNKRMQAIKQPIRTDDPEYNDLRNKQQILGAERRRYEKTMQDFKNNNYDVLDRLFEFISSSQHFPVGWLDNLKQEFKLQIENIQAYVERGEIPHPATAFDDGRE